MSSVSCTREFTIHVTTPQNACFAFEESADPIIDSVGGHSLTSTGAIVPVTGIIGNGLNVNSWEAESAETSDFKYLTSDFTVRIWVNMDWSGGILGQSQFPVIRNHDSDWSWELYMTTDGSHRGPNWTVYDAVGTSYVVNSNAYLTPGWHRIIAWVKTGVEIGMKLDNAADVTVPFATTIYDPSATGSGLFFANGGSGWDDEIDECRIWNRALTPAEMLTDWNGGAGTGCT